MRTMQQRLEALEAVAVAEDDPALRPRPMIVRPMGEPPAGYHRALRPAKPGALVRVEEWLPDEEGEELACDGSALTG